GLFPAGHFGLEVTFARKLKEKGYNPAIFKYALGSTGLANNWKDPGQGGLYDSMVKELAGAVESLKMDGHTIKFQGFIWIQGESDAMTKPMALAYEGRLKNLIDNLRDKVVQTPEMPVILGVDEQHPWVVANPEVVTAQQNLSKALKDCAWTSMKGLEKADSTHLNPAGLVLHGERIYHAYEKLTALAKDD
ncbi:MAG: sialate O-acetylesterase, partial [Kiritimatiellae bacterium]|nr:sialate O-acetylesterase [Kiritimatiellia bacterium]